MWMMKGRVDMHISHGDPVDSVDSTDSVDSALLILLCDF